LIALRCTSLVAEDMMQVLIEQEKEEEEELNM
jgi:hypothetical protein